MSNKKVLRLQPVVFSMTDYRQFLDPWLNAVDYFYTVCLYDDWRVQYFELYDLAAHSGIFDGDMMHVSIGRMIILYLVVAMSKMAVRMLDLLLICGIPSDLLTTCTSALFQFLRSIFRFTKLKLDKYDITLQIESKLPATKIWFAQSTNPANIEYALKDLRNDTDGDINASAFVEIFCHYYMVNRHGSTPAHLPELLNVLQTTNSTWLVTKLLPHHFEDFIECELTCVSLKKAFQQLCFAVKSLHSIGIAHRDIKSQNILFDKNWDLVLIDFGICSLYHSKQRTTFPVCTITTRPPEQLFHDSSMGQDTDFNSFKMDIWSLGCVLSALAHPDGEYLFAGSNHKTICKSVRSVFSDPVAYVTPYMKKILGTKGITLMWKLVAVNPSDRPTINEILDDAFFK
jgi:serine/threonine protein kinase